MGWQSNPAAHIPEMAMLSCPLPSRDARLRIQHSPASLAGATLVTCLADARQLHAVQCLMSSCTGPQCGCMRSYFDIPITGVFRTISLLHVGC